MGPDIVLYFIWGGTIYIYIYMFSSMYIYIYICTCTHTHAHRFKVIHQLCDLNSQCLMFFVSQVPPPKGRGARARGRRTEAGAPYLGAWRGALIEGRSSGGSQFPQKRAKVLYFCGPLSVCIFVFFWWAECPENRLFPLCTLVDRLDAMHSRREVLGLSAPQAQCSVLRIGHHLGRIRWASVKPGPVGSFGTIVYQSLSLPFWL